MSRTAERSIALIIDEDEHDIRLGLGGSHDADLVGWHVEAAQAFVEAMRNPNLTGQVVIPGETNARGRIQVAALLAHQNGKPCLCYFTILSARPA